MAITVRLTAAQISALECAGLGYGDEPCAVERAWRRRDRLVFEAADRDALFSALTDLSNGEDAAAEQRGADATMRRFARRASRSLACVASRVLRAEVR